MKTGYFMVRKLMCIGLFVLLAFGSTSQAAIWYVDGDHLSSGTGNSWHEAMVTIHEAVTAAASWDEIWVKQGVYNLTSSITINDKDVRLYGGFTGFETSHDQRDWAANPTTIDGTGYASTCMFILQDMPTIDGFTIRNCTGGAIYLENCWSEVPIIRNMVFANNGDPGLSYGGALNIYNSSPIITNTSFWGNQAGLGGAIYNNCASSPHIVNSTFTQNSASDGGAFYNTKFCSFGTPFPTISNSILWGDSATNGENEIDGAFSVAVYHSDINQAGYNFNNNISQDPVFFGIERPHLRSGSPAIDAGNNTAVYIPDKDFDGENRIIDGDENGMATVDMGADEYVPGTTFGIWYVDSSIASPGNGTSWNQALATIEEAVGNASVVGTAIAGDEIWVREGTYTPDEGSVIAPLNITKGNIGLYGGFAGGETQRDQRDWQVNLTTINGENSFSRTVYASETGSGATIDGFTFTGHGGTAAVVEFAPGSAFNTVANCKFTANNKTSVQGSSALNVLNSSFVGNTALSLGMAGVTGTMLTVTDSTFLNNQAISLSVSGSGATIDRNKFIGNTTVFSGAAINVHISDGVIVSNSLFVSNHAEQAANNGGGGAIYINSTGGPLSVKNSTFHSNSTAGKGGAIGAYDLRATYTVDNSILWDNTGTDPYPGLVGFPIVEYSNLDLAGYAGIDGNISDEPLFVDSSGDPAAWDFRLNSSSPGIDAGNNSVLDICGIDLSSQQRFSDDPTVPDTGMGSGSIIDMGAYERQVDLVAGQYDLTVSTIGTGTTVPAAGVHTYPACTLVEVQAIADPNGLFLNWTGNVADPSAPQTQIAINGDQAITANFKQVASLTTQVQGTGSGIITSTVPGINCGTDCSETYDADTEITLTAGSVSGVFSGWIGGGCSGTADCTTTLSGDTTVVAAINLEGTSCTDGDTLALENVIADASNTLEACTSITAGNGLEIVNPASVVFIAGDHVGIVGEFSVGLGAEFSVQIEPLLRSR